MARIIGLCGKMQHGKDTAAGALVARGYKRMAFADPLREALLKIDPVVVVRQGPNGVTNDEQYPITWLNRLSKLVDLVGWGEAKKSHDVRRLLQVFGTEVVRDTFGEDSWCKVMARRIAELPPEQHVVITDVRFANEGDFIKEMGGLLLWIHRPSIEREQDVSQHVSEKMDVASMADFRIDNIGSISDLHCRVLSACGITTQEEVSV
jgi:hypothetical protein